MSRYRKKLTIENYHPLSNGFSVQRAILKQVEIESIADWARKEESVELPKYDEQLILKNRSVRKTTGIKNFMRQVLV